MEALAIIATIITAINKGVDSRDRIGDDWSRRTFV